jgi:hypothetical protein
MERNPLYFSESDGGLTSVAAPDTLSPTIIPSIQTLLALAVNANTHILSSASHRLIAVTHSSVEDILAAELDLTYLALAYDANSDVYYFPTATEPVEYLAGVCLGVTLGFVVIQVNGLITPLSNTPFPNTNQRWFLGELGELFPTGDTQIINNKLIEIKGAVVKVKQAIVSGGLTTTGLTVGVQAGTEVTIGAGNVTHSIKYPVASTIATLPANSTRWLYINPAGEIEQSTKEYIVVPTQLNLDNQLVLANVSTGSKSSGIVVSGNTIRATTTGTWGCCYVDNPRPFRFQYYEFTYASSPSNTQFGVATLKPSGVTLANVNLDNQAATGLPQNVLWSMTTATTGFTKPASSTEWTINYATTSAVGSTPRVHGILIDQQARTVYWRLDGTWLNGGNPVATHAGTEWQIVPVFALANDTTYITFNAPSSAIVFPAIVIPYNYYDKSTNTSYSYNYTTTPITISYSPKMYLAKAVSNANSITLTQPPLNNFFSSTVSVSGTTTVTHNLRSHTPNVQVAQFNKRVYTISSDVDNVYIATNAGTATLANVTVT